MALALVAAFYVVAVALITALVWVAVAGSTVWTILCAILAALVAAVAWSVSRFRPVVPAGPSFPVDPEAQPEFWSLARSVAGEVNVKPPNDRFAVGVLRTRSSCSTLNSRCFTRSKTA